jgi:elongator complex protein 2
MWDPTASYVLTTSADQTTRVFAAWNLPESEKATWHEMARPQIHGYDLNAAAFISPYRIVSCGDEKVVRVFEVPRGFVQSLENVGAMPRNTLDHALAVSGGANVPALGLSNKSMGEDALTDAVGKDVYLERQSYSATGASATALARLATQWHPPLEDHLLQHTLWPESEKLYGHAYEVQAIASSPDGHTVTCACKSSAKEHAILRAYLPSNDWREVTDPKLEAHYLSVTTLRFSPCGTWLLSAGRDRSWALWQHSPTNPSLKFLCMKEKAHARIIWDACWSPSKSHCYFITGSRDKTVRLLISQVGRC